MKNNIAFIDGQNLYMATSGNKEKPWRIDLKKFKKYLYEKYNVEKAYYFLGYVVEENNELYDSIQSSGFILNFREHKSNMLGKKKGNVDGDIIFHIMKKIYKKEISGKVILVSGDGDYKQLVDFLIKEKKFGKILFPEGNKASSLYKTIGSMYFDNLDKKDIRKKISYSTKMKKAP